MINDGPYDLFYQRNVVWRDDPSNVAENGVFISAILRARELTKTDRRSIGVLDARNQQALGDVGDVLHLLCSGREEGRERALDIADRYVRERSG